MNDMSTARITVLLVLVFLAGMQVIEVGQAKLFHFVTFGPEIPGSTPPLISIYPHNNTMCSSNLTLSLHISKPLLIPHD